jgi:hypothetical protein
MDLIEKFKYLPDELIHIIINYTNVLVYRNGKYIDRINKNDYRYILLKKIPRPICVGRHKVLLRLMSCNMMGYFIEYNMQEKLIKVNIRFFYREMEGLDKYFDIKSNKTYIFDIDNNWSSIINYLM